MLQCWGCWLSLYDLSWEHGGEAGKGSGEDLKLSPWPHLCLLHLTQLPPSLISVPG